MPATDKEVLKSKLKLTLKLPSLITAYTAPPAGAENKSFKTYSVSKILFRDTGNLITFYFLNILTSHSLFLLVPIRKFPIISIIL